MVRRFRDGRDRRRSGSPIERDVLVVGSGAAGLAAALAAAVGGCRVTVLEKAALLGGTTALSGGTCWIPNNHPMESAGVEDSLEEALAYMRSLSFGLLDDPLIEAFVDHAPKVIPWIEKLPGLRFGTVHGYRDHHPERPGGKPSGGRSLDPGLYSFHQSGTHAELVAPPPRNVHLTLEDVPLGGGTRRLEPEVLSYRQEFDLRGFGQAPFREATPRSPPSSGCSRRPARRCPKPQTQRCPSSARRPAWTPWPPHCAGTSGTDSCARSPLVHRARGPPMATAVERRTTSSHRHRGPAGLGWRAGARGDFSGRTPGRRSCGSAVGRECPM